MGRHVVGALALWLVGCGGEDTELLDGLNGTWTGTITVSTGAIPAAGSFAYDTEEQLLTGELVIEDPSPDVPHTYAVRRWETIRGVAYLDLTDVDDGTRALDLDGDVGKAFSGDAVVRYPCGKDTCGYEGTFELVKGGTPPGTTPTPTAGGSGA